MKLGRKVAIGYLAAVFLCTLAAGVVAPHDYAEQFRDHTGEAPSAEFLLGTDDLGRDRFSRLLFAMRVSLLIGPVTAAGGIAVAALLGILSGWRGGWTDAAIGVVSDLFLSLPLLFLVLTLRALLPLNASSGASIVALAAVLACVGWPSGMRVIRAVTSELRHGPSITHARACGYGTVRLVRVHVLPLLRPVIAAQFWILVPAFLIAEANLGILGLGVSEPLPSIGNMLTELRDYQRIAEAPWILAPAGLLVSILTALHFLLSGGPLCE
jgi:ABC-type dipeptide/oligopeptide/nickel transport system permease subunit